MYTKGGIWTDRVRLHDSQLYIIVLFHDVIHLSSSVLFLQGQQSQQPPKLPNLQNKRLDRFYSGSHSSRTVHNKAQSRRKVGLTSSEGELHGQADGRGRSGPHDAPRRPEHVHPAGDQTPARQQPAAPTALEPLHGAGDSLPGTGDSLPGTRDPCASRGRLWFRYC